MGSYTSTGGAGGRIVAHIEISCPYTVPYAGLVGLSGAVLADAHESAWRLVGAWASSAVAVISVSSVVSVGVGPGSGGVWLRDGQSFSTYP